MTVPVAATLRFANNIAITPASPIVPGQTIITLPTGEGAALPSTGVDLQFKLTVEHRTNGFPDQIEVWDVVSRSGDQLTVQRAQEGTTDQGFPVENTLIELRATAGTFDKFVQRHWDSSNNGSLVRVGSTGELGPTVLVAGDIPNIDAASVTSGVFANARISGSSVTQYQGSLQLSATQITAGQLPFERIISIQDQRLLGRFAGTSGQIQQIALGTGLILSVGGVLSVSSSGTVTSVAVSSSDLSVSGSPITTSGTIALSILNGAVTYAKLQNVAASRLLGNSTGAPANVSEISLGTNLAFAGSVLNATGGFDLDASYTVNGVWTYTNANSVVLHRAGPSQVQFNDSTLGAGNRRWAIRTTSQSLTLSAQSDSGTLYADAIVITREQQSIEGIVMNAAGGGMTFTTTGAGGIVLNAAAVLQFSVGGSNRLVIQSDGAWAIAGVEGTAGQVLTSNGNAASPTWQTAGGGSGTVTSVGIASTDLSVAGSPITTSGNITLNINNDAVTYAKIQNVSASRLLGRATASIGDIEEITLGTNLSFAGTTLNAGGGGSGTVTSVGIASTDLSVAGSPITVSGNITLNINNDAVTYAKIQNVAASRLLGRATASIGDIEEITLGTNLSFAGTVLNAAGGGGSPGGATTQVQYNNAGVFAGDADFTWDATNNVMTVGGASFGRIQGGATANPGLVVGGGTNPSGGGGFGQLVGGPAGAAGNDGGAVTVQGGAGLTTGGGGTVTVAGGASISGTAGDVTVRGGNCTTGVSGNLTVRGGIAITTGAGGSVSVIGSAGVGTNQNGGLVTITSGAATGSGTAGYIVFSSSTTGAAVERFRILANGAWSVGSAGTNTGTAGTEQLTSNGASAAPTWQASASDRALKRNIGDILLGLPFIESLRPVTFRWIDYRDDGNVHHGLIAQEVEALGDADILGGIVGICDIPDKDGIMVKRKQLRYNEITPVLIKAVQELSLEVRRLTALLN